MIATILLATALQTGFTQTEYSPLVPEQPAQSSGFGYLYSVDGDRAVVARSSELVLFERIAGAWVEQSSHPSSLHLAEIRLTGDKLYLSLSSGSIVTPLFMTEVWDVSGATWVQTDVIDHFVMRAVDAASGTAIGFSKLNSVVSIAVAERAAAGWSIVWTSPAGFAQSFGVTDFVIRDQVAVLGFGRNFTCSHTAYDGGVAVVERSAPLGLPGQWSLAANLSEPDGCVESRFGFWVATDGQRAFATAYNGFPTQARIRVITKGSSDVWSITHEIMSQPGEALGLGLDARPGRLLTGASFATPTATAVVLREDSPDSWSFERRLRVPDWQSPHVQNSMSPKKWVAFVDEPAPIQTGVGSYLGVVLASDRELPNSNIAFASFDPTISGAVCDGVANATGQPAHLEVTGSKFLSADRLNLEVNGLPAQTLVLPLVSMTFSVISNPSGSVGNLCLGSAPTRMTALAASAENDGTFSCSIDLASFVSAAPVSGDRLFFQAWYRDIPGNNFTSSAAIQLF